jgi:NAD(P) transhydrogenase subunit alpha
MKFGIVKESTSENRVIMLPEVVSTLTSLKVQVLVEKGAGERAWASDHDYVSAGAAISSRKEILSTCDAVGMINPPTQEDLQYCREGMVLIAALNPFFNIELLKQIASKKIIAFSLEMIPRTTRAQAMDILSSQATVSGYKAVLDAANTFGEFLPMFMTAAGTIKPAKVLILGAGVAGLQAIATSRKLGAVVEAFDVRAAVKEEVQSLGAKFVEVEGAADSSSAGGYAVEQSEEYKKKQQQAVHDHAVKSDIIISTAQIFGKKAPILLKKETVEAMRPGSVIVDLAASTGGNCELTKNGETVNHNGVRIIGRSDYPSGMPTDASRMFGKNVLNFFKLIIEEDGSLNLNYADELVAGTCVAKDGEIVHEKLKNL